MHVHGNHLSPPLPIETPASVHKIAAQRAEAVRRKLLEGASNPEDDADGEDRLMVRRWTEQEEAPSEQEPHARPAARVFQRQSEDEEALEEEENSLGTSMWA